MTSASCPFSEYSLWRGSKFCSESCGDVSQLSLFWVLCIEKIQARFGLFLRVLWRCQPIVHFLSLYLQREYKPNSGFRSESCWDVNQMSVFRVLSLEKIQVRFWHLVRALVRCQPTVHFLSLTSRENTSHILAFGLSLVETSANCLWSDSCGDTSQLLDGQNLVQISANYLWFKSG